MNITSIILILASFGLFFGYIDPTYTKIKTLGAEKADYDRALNNSKELQEERDKFLDKYNQMNPEDRTRLLKALPDNIDNVRLIIDIDEIAKKFGMRIRNFTTETEDNSETIGSANAPYGTLTLSFSTTASYNTFLAFMRTLEQSLRVIDVSSIQFAASDTSQLYDYGVQVKTYWLK